MHDSEQMQPIKAQISKLTDEMSKIRKDMRTCLDIAERDGVVEFIRLKLDREVFSLWKNLKNTDIPMTVTVKDLPLSWWNCWLPYDTTFRFRSGMGYAEAEVTAKNLCRDFYLNIDGGVKGASFGLDDTVWIAGDCTVKGRASFPDYFRDIEFHSIRLAALDQGKEYISFHTDGFAGINTDRETSLQFTSKCSSAVFSHR